MTQTLQIKDGPWISPDAGVRLVEASLLFGDAEVSAEMDSGDVEGAMFTAQWGERVCRMDLGDIERARYMLTRLREALPECGEVRFSPKDGGILLAELPRAGAGWGGGAMSTVDLHNEAMALALEADAARKAGNLAEAAEHFARAMDVQRRAAELETTQPSRAIMFRSAAWLAVEAGKLRAAERIAMYALVDDGIPARVQEELREVCREVRVRVEGWRESDYEGRGAYDEAIKALVEVA